MNMTGKSNTLEKFNDSPNIPWFEAPSLKEKHHDDLIAAFDFDSHAGTASDRDPGADNSIRSEVVFGLAGNVHGTAPSFTIPGSLAHYFGHHQFQIGTFADTVTVAAMSADDVITLSQSRASTGCNSFLTKVWVQITANESLPVQFDAL
jgi:hypothetical protein